MKTKYLLFLFLISCSKDVAIDTCADTLTIDQPPCQSFIDVTNSPCIIKEAISKLEGGSLRKYVYFDNGSNYHRIDVYFKGTENDSYPELPVDSVTLTYYDDGKIKEVIIQTLATQDRYLRHSYTYINNTIRILEESIVGNKVVLTASGEQPSVIEPPDSYYSNLTGYPPYLLEFNNGNTTRFADGSQGGACIIDNHRWEFIGKMIYDSNPNIFREYAVRYSLGGPFGLTSQFWLGNNNNNIVANVDPANPTSIDKTALHS